jgi:hypothetical protein
MGLQEVPAPPTISYGPCEHHIGKPTPGICVCLVKEERPPVGSKPFLDGVG